AFAVIAGSRAAAAKINFQYPQLTISTVNPLYIASGDFNNDGILDIVVTDYATSNAIQVLLGNGQGTFTPLAPIYSFNIHHAVVTSDFNLDGNLDLIVIGYTGPEELLGNGDGTFQAPLAYAGGDDSIAVADFNGDGIPDVATSSYQNADTKILLGDG